MPVQADAVPGEEDDEDEQSFVIDGWELTDVNEDGIAIELSFGNPLSVSSKDQADFLFV